MEAYVKRHKYSVVEAFVGHGIGRDMHEDPQVPNFVNSQLRRGSGDFRLAPGLIIAIEPMVNMGTKRVRRRPTTGPGDGRRTARRPFRAYRGHYGKRPLAADGRAERRDVVGEK